MKRGSSPATLVLAGLTLPVLVLSMPGSVRESYDRGGLYRFSQAFFEDIPRRLAGPGRFRFILQPLVASVLGIRGGLADARAGRPPYLYGLLFHREERGSLLRDGVLFAALASINGLKNQETSVGGVSPPDPEFLRVLALLRNIQRSGAVALRVRPDPEKHRAVLLTFRTQNTEPKIAEEASELRRLLRLDPKANEFSLVMGSTATHDREVAVVTRSLLHQLQTLASQVEIPAEDLAHGAATPGWESLPAGSTSSRLIEIHSSKDKPDHASVSIAYRDHWFWSDDYDLTSKRVFAFMMMLFTLADTGEKENLPLITIPAQ
jgi:hypothetical protein